MIYLVCHHILMLRSTPLCIRVDEIPHLPLEPRLEHDRGQGQGGQLRGVPGGHTPQVQVGVCCIVP